QVIEAILQEATYAPSWKNSQCWRFYVVTEPTALKNLKEQGLPEGNR
ncbi:Nitroreductase-like protein, partial [gut metagenome]